MKRDKAINRALSIFFTILSLAWIYPVFMIALNSFKKGTAISTTTAFDLLTPETFNGFANYVHALNEQGFASAFMYSLIITVTSVVLILVCCSMCAWYVVRVNNKISNFFYYLFVFSMVVPFQMLMFTLSNLADRIGFNTPFNICFIYLGFGAGLAVFMFAGFVKNIPLEIEEAAMIDGCNPVQVFFKIVLPIMKPTYLSVGILETMWVWNDYLLPYLTLDSTKYKTIPILIQYFRGGYGHVELGPMMACIMMVVVPIVIMYIFCQKYIMDGVRPEQILLADKDEEGALQGTVEVTELMGSTEHVHVTAPDGQFVLIIPVVDLDVKGALKAGDTIWFKFEKNATHLFDKVSGKNLI